jgi:hypothetical protein
MSEFQEPINQSTTGTPRWVGLAVAVLAGISVLGLGVAWSAIHRADGIAQTTQASLKQQNDALSQRLAKAEEINQELGSELRAVTDKLNMTQSDLNVARKQTRNSAYVYDKKLNGFKDEVNTKLATKANVDDVNKLNGDVSGVKSDLDTTKNSLQMARSELGTLIARNHDEIDQLRRMGQRDYFEFTVSRKGGAQNVGGIKVQLKSTNVKKNQFTMNVLADDKTYEKKNRSVNEPIFFYTAGSHSALELVVNKVTKATASGYVSVPKAQPATSAVASTTSGSGQ